MHTLFTPVLLFGIVTPLVALVRGASFYCFVWPMFIAMTVGAIVSSLPGPTPGYRSLSGVGWDARPAPPWAVLTATLICAAGLSAQTWILFLAWGEQ